MLMTESAVQTPALTHTIETDLDQHWHDYMWCGLGEARKMELRLTCNGWEEDGENRQENVGAAHGCDLK
jgi:hypothetical protein